MENIGLEDRGNAQISEILAALVSKGSFGNRTPEVKAETNVIGRVDRAPIVLGGGVHARRHSKGRVEYSAKWTIQYLRDGRIPISRVICVCCTAVKNSRTGSGHPLPHLAFPRAGILQSEEEEV